LTNQTSQTSKTILCKISKPKRTKRFLFQKCAFFWLHVAEISVAFDALLKSREKPEFCCGEKPEFCCGLLDVLLKDEGDGGER
jgi:hypothetical protein